MQDFFIKSIKIEPNINLKEKNNTEYSYISDLNIIKKEIDISGIIELFTRTMLPVHIFEVLINEQIVDIFKYNLSELKFFGRDNNDTLRDTMFNLSTSILKYYDTETFKEKAEKQKNIGTLNNKYFKYKSNIIYTTNDKNSYKSNKKIIGIFLEKKYKDFFGNYSVFIEKYTDFRRDEEIYFLSPLKFYSILPLYFKAILEDKPKKIQFLIEDLTKEYTPDINIIYGIAFPLLTNEDIIFTIENSNLGVISIDTFSKKLVQNILRISIQHYDDHFIKTLSNSTETQYRRFLDKNINAYKTIYFNHLVLFLVKKIDNNIFNNLHLDLRDITHGTREEDFYKDKIKESFFADNIKKILIKIQQDKKVKEKYKAIEPFIYKLYLTLLKNKTYQNSFYIKRDKDFDIKKYIIQYYKEIKNGNNIKLKKTLVKKEGQFKELRDLYKNLNNLYAEADYSNKKYKIIG